MGGLAGEAVVVDLDGTVWDSAPWYKALASRSGKPVPQGLTAARLLRAVGIGPQRFSNVCATAETPLKVYVGIAPALRRLASGGVGLGAVTNLPEWMAEPMLSAAGLDDVLDVVVDFNATSRHKPRPDPLIEACRRLGCRPQRAWYVGDAPTDAAAALAAGMSFAWASWGYADDPPAAVRRILKRPRDIAKLLQERA